MSGMRKALDKYFEPAAIEGFFGVGPKYLEKLREPEDDVIANILEWGRDRFSRADMRPLATTDPELMELQRVNYLLRLAIGLVACEARRRCGLEAVGVEGPSASDDLGPLIDRLVARYGERRACTNAINSALNMPVHLAALTEDELLSRLMNIGALAASVESSKNTERARETFDVVMGVAASALVMELVRRERAPAAEGARP